MQLEDGMARFDKITEVGGEGKNQWFTVELHEGRNREVRRLWESQGVQVNRLSRNMFGNVRLPRGLKKGKCEELTKPQIEQLYASVQIPSPFEQDKKTKSKTKIKAKTKAKTKTERRSSSHKPKKKIGRKKRA